jgi:hypothetical protein
MGVPVRRIIVGFIACLVFLGGAASADTPQRKTAILVEIHSIYNCVGLDCLPWPVPDDSYFCFQAGDNFYTGVYHPLALWATKGERLLKLKGKTVEILVTDKHIKVGAPGIKIRLRRLHDDSFFKSASCSHN